MQTEKARLCLQGTTPFSFLRRVTVSPRRLVRASSNPPSPPPFGKVIFTHKAGCWTPAMLTLAIAAGKDGSSFVPGLPVCVQRTGRPAWSLLSQLRSGEGAPSLFSSLLRSDEPGAPPSAAAEVAQASRSHFRRTIIARTCIAGVSPINPP